MEDKIAIKRVIFRSMPDLILLKEEYEKFGNILKFCSEYSIKLNEIYRIKSELINIRDFPNTAWEG